MTQLKDLDKSLEEGLISKEEYNKKKKEIEAIPDVKTREIKENAKGVKLKSDRILIVAVFVVVLIFAVILGSKNSTPDTPETIDELHELNLKGELKPEQGYLYKGVYSFVKVDDVWYTELLSPTGKTSYNFNFRYSPRDLENIEIKGKLDVDKFNDASQYYATFNPLGNNFSHIRLARLDYDLQMIRIFQKNPVSACDRNVTNGTTACVGIPIITCDNTKDIVVYYKESEELNLEYDDNCIIISGSGLDFVKGVDRVLYNLYGIMD